MWIQGNQTLKLETRELENKSRAGTYTYYANCSIPFSMDEISQSFRDIDVSNVDPPPLLRQRSDFHFLLQITE